MKRTWMGVAIAIAVATSCGSPPDPDPAASNASPTATPTADPTVLRCDPQVPEVFAEWELLVEVEVPSQDRVGVRQTYGQGDHTVTLMFGIRGEVGEGLALTGQRETTTGALAALRGSGDTWALTWREAGTCGDRVVLGAGFTQADFEHLMAEARILAS